MPARSLVLPRSLQVWGMVLLVAGLVFVCYLPALPGGMLWDDPAHVTRPELRTWHGLVRIWTDLHATQQYYPVLFSAFWVEHRLWGDATVGYHLFNVLLHTTSCCLLALLLQRLWTTSNPESDGAPVAARSVPAGAAWFAAILFAVHPVSVESVAWITEQKNALAMVFYLLAGLAYVRFMGRRTAGSYLLASVLFLLAMGSKTTTVVLPAALVVVIWWKRGRPTWRRDIAPLIPWFLAAAAMGLVTSWVERKVIGAEGAEFHLSFFERWMLAGRVVWFYLGKLLWPTELMFYYPRWNVPAEAAGWIGWFAALVVATGLLWVIRHRTRGALAAWLLYLGGLFPVMGFFNVFFFRFSYVNDHFQYFACLSLLAGAAAGVALGLGRLPSRLRAAGRVACVVLVVLLALLANRQSRLYRDNVTLFHAAIARNPSSWMAHHILAVTLGKTLGRHEEAIAEYRAALRLNPDYPDAHFGLGVELARLPGHQSDAIAEYERAVQLRPIYVEAHNNLGLELARLPGRTTDAIMHFEVAFRLKPDFAEAHANLGDVLSRMPGRETEAIAHYEAALKVKPELAWVHCHLGFVLSKTPGRETDAVAEYLEAVRLRPDYVDARNGLAITYAQLGRPDQARAQWEAALKIDPGNETVRRNLRLLEQMQGP